MLTIPARELTPVLLSVVQVFVVQQALAGTPPSRLSLRLPAQESAHPEQLDERPGVTWSSMQAELETEASG